MVVWFEPMISSLHESVRLCDDNHMKAKPEYEEGPQAWARFEKAMKAIIAVPHSVIQQRIEAHRKQAAKNPHKRGPKPKRGGASRVPAAEV